MKGNNRNRDERFETIYQRDPQIHGSAQWADKAYLKTRGFGPDNPLLLGYGLPEHDRAGAFPIAYGGARHLLTVAPTRSGKAVSAAVPALLSHKGPMVIIDPKGELALITARYRRDVLGHDVYIADPWNIACEQLDMDPARFNPLDWLDPESDDFIEDALLIADALVMTSARGEPFWPDEARAVIMGLIAHVASSLKEKPTRNLGRVRDLLNLDTGAFDEFLEQDMARADNVYARAAAGRIGSKAEKERASVMSTAQQNAHFLESPRIRASLEDSDFDFSRLENGKTDIYLVLPAGRLGTHSRWLRLMLNIAITAVSRFAQKPDPPVYFLLEEMGALGRLDVIENAYGLMAGYGMQLHCIAQDLNQLANLYGDRWQSFIANSGVVQVFGTRDLMTADYISRLCGTTTIESLSEYTSQRRASLFGRPDLLTRHDQVQSRSLITSDEVMTMHPAAQILILANAHPVNCFKTAYFLDSRFRLRNGQPVYDIHPHHKNRPQPKAYDFTSPRVNVARILDHYISGG